MREIKFRAWDKRAVFVRDDGTLPKGIPHMKYDVGIMAANAQHDYAGGVDGINIRVNSESFILMQYTGLKDKNGKEIYEGDIIESKEGVFTVEEWSDGVYRVVSNGMTWDWLHQLKSKGYLEHGKGNYEIIGNIYENPELLNVEIK